jgi:membrane protease YdiL (CAAX protease family)
VIPSFASDPQLLEELERATSDGGILAAWVQALGFVVLGMLGVGLFARRDWRETLARLGLTRRFSVRWWLGSVLLGLVAAFATEWLWSWLQPESMAEVSRISDALFQAFIEAGLWGAITVGVSAGIGEEILFRGAAQPRLGLVFTSLAFAVLHTQYTVSPALAQVFFIGLLLGLVRRRVNTTTAIGVHATYNFVLVLLAIYAPELGP